MQNEIRRDSIGKKIEPVLKNLRVGQDNAINVNNYLLDLKTTKQDSVDASSKKLKERSSAIEID